MTDWTAGYVADIGYTIGYQTELNPLRTSLAFLNAGLLPPDNGIHCELGFGQGLGANIHAAASARTWYGTDFNPAQAGFAQAMASASGADAHLSDQSFAAFCARPDLPDFDSIGLHGIWSWVDDENRKIIVDFVGRKLKVGGVLYISYNAQPGWAAFTPMRDLLLEHKEVMGTLGSGIAVNFDAALHFAEKLMATRPLYAKDNPRVQVKLASLKKRDRNYLVHEYFNRNWLPMSFADVARWLSPAKLDYACSANFLDDMDRINLSAEQQSLLKTIPDAMFRQTVRDFCVDKQFRKDYWVKGARRLNSLEQTEALRTQSVILLSPRAEVTLRVSGTQGPTVLEATIYNPVLDALADHQPRSLAQLEQAVLTKGVNWAQLTQAVTTLIGIGHLAAVQDPAQTAKASQFCSRLNARLIDKARGSSEIGYLASPVTGGGVAVERIEQLFLLALRQGKEQSAEWAQWVAELQIKTGQSSVNQGKLETPQEYLVRLTTLAQTFAEKRLPILKALLI